MTRVIKPTRLRSGDVIGVCAPASPPHSNHDLELGVRYLERLGFRVKLAKHVFKRLGYLAGTDAQRASDLNKLFGDRSVKAIFTVRGGYGSHRILPFLDYSLIKKNPKILVGYSDITALHFALMAKTGLITFSGPMVASELKKGLSANVEESFWQLLMSTKPPAPLKKIDHEPHFNKRSKPKTGRLLGGNLTLIATLLGTPYVPITKNSIFLLEEIDEQPYRINRMLQQMKLAGMFERASGVALGNFTGCKAEKNKPSLTLQQIFNDIFAEYSFPVLSGIHYGHIARSVSFPIGGLARLDTAKGEITFLESVVH